MKERYFKVLLMCDHVGRGKSLEVARHITANNCFDAFYIGNRMPRVKKKSSKSGTITVLEISIEEFAKGKVEERENYYLKYPAII